MIQTKTKFIAQGIFLAILLSYAPIHAQFRPQALRFSVANEGSVLPSWRLYQSPIHPTFSVGIDTKTKSNHHWRRTFGLELGFFYHRQSENALMLDLTYIKGYQIGRFQPKFLVSLGYKHSLPVSEVYRLKDGQYTKAAFWGKAQFAPKIGIGLEYVVNDKISLTTDYKIMLSLPYSDAVPFSPHTFLGVGVKLKLKNDD